MGCDIVDENNKWFWILGAGVVLLMSMPLWNKKNADTDCVGCGCKDCGEKKRAEARVTRGEEVFNSEMNQDVSGPSTELNRINPVEVGGAEDIYGAESFNTDMLI